MSEGSMSTGAGIAAGLGSIALGLAAAVLFYTWGWSPGCSPRMDKADAWEDCKSSCARIEHVEERKLCKEQCFEVYKEAITKDE